MKKPVIDNASDLRIGIFRILAVGGFFVSAVTGVNALIIDLPVRTVAVCLVTALLSLALIIVAERTGRYRVCVIITIVIIFLGIFTFLFFDGGGYKSGMPLYFVMAVVFTAFMLEGKEMYILAAVELCWYGGLCYYAFRHPETVVMIDTEGGLVTDILIALAVVCVVLAATMYLQLRLLRKKQAQLEQARKDALSASEAKTSFLANMSHDIRTPLNTVIALNGLISDRTASDEIRGWTDDIRLSCDILLSLINDILDLSRIESGKVRLSEGPYLTAQLLKETEAIWKGASEKSGLTFDLEADESLPSVMSGSLDSIRKIVNNLAGNAVKYTDRGGITLRFGKEPAEEETGGKQIIFSIEVLDTGVGISPEDIETIFLPFERGGHSSKHSREGTGLGLAIVKDLADAMHGAVKCESTPGLGSRFTVRIPQTVQDPEPIGPREHWAGITSQAETFDSIIAPDAKILVVDDNEYNRQVMCTLLKPTLILTDDVESGKDALEMLEIRDYDLILMDIMMSEMDGPETLKKIREAHLADDTPVVALTADALTGTRERLLNAGFSEYLPKPVNMKQLGDLLIKYLGDRIRLIRDTAVEKMPEEHISRLKDMLAGRHLHLEDVLELDGGSVEGMCMRAEHFLNYRNELEKFSGAGDTDGEQHGSGEINEDAFREELLHFVHSLKSAARGVGARDLAELAAFMERHREDTSLNRLMIPVLTKEYLFVSEGEELLLKELSKRNEAEHEE